MANQIITKLVLGYEYTFSIPDPDFIPDLEDEVEDINFLSLSISQAQEAKGVLIKCDVSKGKGKFSLKKDGRFVGNTYLLSAEPGDPASVEFRTLTADEMELYKKDLPIKNWELHVEAQDQSTLEFSVVLI